MKKKILQNTILFFICLIVLPCVIVAQEKEILKSADSIRVINSITPGNNKFKKEKVYHPRKAAIRSAILPGWGQAYNKKYWKLPVVYGALGTSAYILFSNLQSYRDTRFAYKVKYKMRQPGATAADSALFNDIPDYLERYSEGSLLSYRDSYRRDIDYSALFFALLWGLNVIDAAVDAHLKSFDISPDLSLHFKPGYSEMADTNGFSLVFNLDKKRKLIHLPSML